MKLTTPLFFPQIVPGKNITSGAGCLPSPQLRAVDSLPVSRLLTKKVSRLHLFLLYNRSMDGMTAVLTYHNRSPLHCTELLEGMERPQLFLQIWKRVREHATTANRKRKHPADRLPQLPEFKEDFSRQDQGKVPFCGTLHLRFDFQGRGRAARQKPAADRYRRLL